MLVRFVSSGSQRRDHNRITARTSTVTMTPDKTRVSKASKHPSDLNKLTKASTVFRVAMMIRPTMTNATTGPPPCALVLDILLTIACDHGKCQGFEVLTPSPEPCTVGTTTRNERRKHMLTSSYTA